MGPGAKCCGGWHATGQTGTVGTWSARRGPPQPAARRRRAWRRGPTSRRRDDRRVVEQLLLADLKSGKIDLVFNDGLQLAFWLTTADGAACCRFAVGPYYSDKYLGEGLRIAVAADDVTLRKQIDHALISLQRKGEINELYLRFFPKGFY